jgi:hypothetical protein
METFIGMMNHLDHSIHSRRFFLIDKELNLISI